jgi:O-antigen ligase
MSRADRRSAKRKQLDVGVPPRETATGLRLVGVVVLCLKLALVPLVFDPSADVPFVVPRTLLSHGLTYILLGVLLALSVQKGRSFLVRSWVHVPVLAFFAISALATALALNPTLALFGTHVRMLGLATIADGVVTYFALVHLVRERRDVVALLVSVFVASVLMVSYEAIQLIGRDPFSWAGVDTSLRPISTLGQSTTLGQYLSVLSVCGLALAVLTPNLPPLVRGGLIAYAAVLLYAAGLTGTRAAVLGVAVAAVIFVLLVWTKHPSRSARLLSLISGMGAAALLAGLVLFTPLGVRLLSTVESPNSNGPEDTAIGQLEPSTVTRLAIYDTAARMVLGRPLLGYGPDNFAAALPAFRPPAAPPEIRQSIATSPHSWLAAVATSSGTVGLAAFLAVIGAAAFVLFRSAYSSLAIAAAVVVAAYLASGAVSVNALETDTLFWFGIAAIVGANASQPTLDQTETRFARSRRPRSGSLVRQWIPWVLVTAAVVLSTTTLPALEASRLAKASSSARLTGGVAIAIDLATLASRIDPNRAEYWQELALANVAGAHWTDASLAFEKAAELAPYDIRFLTDDIQVQRAMAHGGDSKALERARKLADQAVRVDPNNPNGHFNRAVVAFDRGDLPAAVESIDRALWLDPNSTNNQLFVVAAQIYVAATQSEVAAGRLDDAIVNGRHGVAQLGSNAASVPIRLELARALVRDGRSGEALDVLDAALALAPTDQSLLQLKQEILRAQ